MNPLDLEAEVRSERRCVSGLALLAYPRPLESRLGEVLLSNFWAKAHGIEGGHETLACEGKLSFGSTRD